jgi:hypothetical protein
MENVRSILSVDELVNDGGLVSVHVLRTLQAQEMIWNLY